MSRAFSFCTTFLVVGDHQIQKSLNYSLVRPLAKNLWRMLEISV
jgi:hypothetical protein